MADLKKISLSVGIAVVFAFFIAFLIDALYSSPEYNMFCKNQEHFPYQPKGFSEFSGRDNCAELLQNETLLATCNEKGGYVAYLQNSSGCQTTPYCELCQKQFSDATEEYNKNLFYVTFPIGLVAIIVGMYLPLFIEAIASGFMFGGILTLIQATVRVFGDLGKFTRVILLGLELVILIWIGYKKVSDKDTSEQKIHAQKKEENQKALRLKK